MRQLKSRASDVPVTRRIGSINLRAYPRPPGPDVPREVMTNELFAPTIDARSEDRRRFGRGISMDVIENALRSAYRGSMRNITDILRETVETDPHLGSILNKRFGAVSALPYEVQPASGPGIDTDKAMFYAEVVRTQLRNMKSFRKNLNQLAWALFDGRACLEMQWVELMPGMGPTDQRFGATSMAVKEMDWIHPRRLSFGPHRELRIQPENVYTGGTFAKTGISVIDPFLSDKFVWWTPQLFGEYPEREGLGIRCMYYSFFKRFAARERMILTELYGKPWRIVTVDEESSAGADELSAADQIVDALGASYTARMPRGTKLEVISPGKSAGEVHQEVITESDKQNSKLVLGQTGTTDGVPAGLNSSQANVMQDEQLGVLIHDAGELSEVIETLVTDRTIAVNFGEDEVTHAPTFKLRGDLPADRTSELGRLDAALKAGLVVGRDEAYDISGFSVPDESQVVIRMDQPPTPPNAPVAPAARPVIIYPEGTTPDVGEQQPPSREAAPDAGLASAGSPAGAASADSTVTVNEDRASRGLEPLTTMEGAPDPRGEMTVKEFDATFEAAEAEAAAEVDATVDVATVEAPPPEEPAKQAMNGAQITSVLDIVDKFRTKQLDHGSALEMLVVIFPFSLDQATKILGSLPDDAEALAQTAVGTPVAAPAVEAVVEDVEDEEDEDEDEDEELDAVGAVVSALGLSRHPDARLGNVAHEIADGEYLYGEAGIHAHELLRALEATALDGVHSHVFQLPSGDFVVTQLDGLHMHGLQNVDVDETLEDGEHEHAIDLGGIVMNTGSGISAHKHTLQVDATAVDGAHKHTLEVPDPDNPGSTILVNSLSAGEYAQILREAELPDFVESHIPDARSAKQKKRKVYADDRVSITAEIVTMPNGKFRVTDSEGNGNFGEYDTHEDAADRLAEIEGFKDRANASVRRRFSLQMIGTGDFDLSVMLAYAQEQHETEQAEWTEWVTRGHGDDCVALEVGQDQQRTPNGSVEDYVVKGMRELTSQTALWANAYEGAVGESTSPVEIFAALGKAHRAMSTAEFGRVMERRKLQSMMLGVLDSVREIGGDEDAGAETIQDVTDESQALGETVTEVQEQTSDVLDGLLSARVTLAGVEDAFTKMPFAKAIAFFKKLGVLDRPSFERATAAIKLRSFTVAGVMNDQMLRTLQDELAKSIARGEDLRRFKQAMRLRLQQSGFLGHLGKLKTGQPALNASHIETVFRTNTLNTYNTGRYVHQSSPAVVAAFPVWEIRSLPPAAPGDRTTHYAANGVKLMANDAFWSQAYPPFGFNCRCRVVSRGRKDVAKVVPGTSVRGLPDRGFTSGRPALALG